LLGLPRRSWGSLVARFSLAWACCGFEEL
jgi:hypothetical protein